MPIPTRPCSGFLSFLLVSTCSVVPLPIPTAVANPPSTHPTPHAHVLLPVAHGLCLSARLCLRAQPSTRNAPTESVRWAHPRAPRWGLRVSRCRPPPHPPSAATRRSPPPRDPSPTPRRLTTTSPHHQHYTRVDAAPAAVGLPVCSGDHGGRSGTDCCRPLSVMHTLLRGHAGRKPRRGTGGPGPLCSPAPPPLHA